LKKLKHGNTVLVVTIMMLVIVVAGSALPAFAQSGWNQLDHSGWKQSDQSGWVPSEPQAPSEPVCGWDWDRYLWQSYGYELWSYTCDYGKDGTQVYAFWNPDWGYWYP
jgi:hypothetical protein